MEHAPDQVQGIGLRRSDSREDGVGLDPLLGSLVTIRTTLVADAARLGLGRAEAEDVVGDLALKVTDRPEAFADAVERGYQIAAVRRATINLALSRQRSAGSLRRATERLASNDAALTLRGTTSSAEDEFLTQLPDELATTAMRFLERLPNRQRRAVEAIVCEGMSYREFAAREEMSDRSAHSLMSSGLRTLRRLMNAPAPRATP